MDKVQHEYVTIRDTLLDFFEGDPLDMKIDKIKLLNKTNYIFDTDLNQEKSDLKPWQNRRNRDKMIKEELEDADPLVQEIFKDRIKIDSLYTTKSNLAVIQKIEQEMEDSKFFAQPEHASFCYQSLKTKWYKPTNTKLTIDPNDLSDIDFLRDLGPFLRELDSMPADEADKIRTKYLQEQLTDVETIDQIFLLVISGYINVEDIEKLEGMRWQPPSADQTFTLPQNDAFDAVAQSVVDMVNSKQVKEKKSA